MRIVIYYLRVIFFYTLRDYIHLENNNIEVKAKLGEWLFAIPSYAKNNRTTLTYVKSLANVYEHAFYCFNAAQKKLQQKNYYTALRLYQKAQSIYYLNRSSLANYRQAFCFEGMANCHYGLEQYGKSRELFYTARSLKSKHYYFLHPEIAKTYHKESLAAFYAKDYASAWKWGQESVKIYQNLLVLGWETKDQKLFIEEMRKPLSTMLFAAEQLQQDYYLKQTITLYQHHKNLLPLLLTKEREILHRTKNKEIYQTYREQQAKRNSLLLAHPLNQRDQREFARLNKNIDAQKQFSFHIPSPTFSQVNLFDNHILLEYVLYYHLNGKRWLGLFLIDNKKTTFMPLGLYKDVKKNIANVLHRLYEDGKFLEQSFTSQEAIKREQKFIAATEKLKKFIWPTKLVMALKPKQKLFLSVVKDLNKIPFGIFSWQPGGKIVYLIERYDICYLGSADEIKKKRPFAGQGLYVAFNPDFDMAFAQESVPTKWRKIANESQLKLVAESFNNSYGERAQIKTGDKVLKEHFKEQIIGKKWIHLNTYAFFAEEKKASGIILAGANKSISKGYVLPLEFAFINLRHNKCFFISHCKSSKKSDFDSIYHLKWALSYAGTRYLLMPLWDKGNEFIADFYKAHQKEPGNIWQIWLQQKRKWLITQRSKQTGKSHPYFWGAFICQGDSWREKKSKKLPKKPVVVKPKKENKQDYTRILVVDSAIIESRKSNGKKWDLGWKNAALPDVFFKVFVLKGEEWEESYKSDKIKNSLNPKWQAVTDIEIVPGHKIQIEIYDKDAVKNDFINLEEIEITKEDIIKGYKKLSFESVKMLTFIFQKKKD